MQIFLSFKKYRVSGGWIASVRGWNFGFNGQGMQALVQEFSQRIIHKPMSRDRRLAGK
jgi:hypothetical protein